MRLGFNGAVATPIYLHVGLKKTGTSYLQGVAWASREALAAQGLALVPGAQREMFDLMLDVRDRYDPEADPARVRGALDRLPGQVRAAGARAALVSEESLSVATREQADRMRAALAGCEVHLVLTVRDLARQVPSAWQQSVQARGSIPFDRYVDAVVRGAGPGARRFRRSQDVLDVLDRWAGGLPPERVHLVTVPQRGAPPGVLAERFFGLLGVDPAGLSEGATFNHSIGRVQAELLARVNGRLPDAARRRDRYGDVGKRYFAQQVLAAQTGRPARMPAAWQSWCVERADEVVAAVRDRGYDVVGDLADLRPDPASFAAQDAEPVTDGELLEAAEEALAALLVDRVAETDERRARQRARLDAAAEPGDRPAGREGLLARLRRRVGQGRA